MKYIVISEFGDVFKKTQITDDDLAASDDGILTIIDTETECLHVLGTKWEKIPEEPNH